MCVFGGTPRKGTLPLSLYHVRRHVTPACLIVGVNSGEGIFSFCKRKQMGSERGRFHSPVRTGCGLQPTHGQGSPPVMLLQLGLWALWELRRDRVRGRVGGTSTPARWGDRSPMPPEYAAVFLPGICSPQLPVTGQFTCSLRGTQIYQENRGIGLIVAGLPRHPSHDPVVSRAADAACILRPLHVAAPVILVSYSERRAFFYLSLRVQVFFCSEEQLNAFLLQHVKRIRVLLSPRDRVNAGKEAFQDQETRKVGVPTNPPWREGRQVG